MMGMTASIVGVKGAKKVGESMVPDVNPPPVEQPTLMPDPLAQQQSRQRSIVEQLSRRGRASTILTQSSGQKLGS